MTRFSLVLDNPDHDETLEDKDTLDKETDREALAAVAERTTKESQIPSFSLILQYLQNYNLHEMEKIQKLLMTYFAFLSFAPVLVPCNSVLSRIVKFDRIPNTEYIRILKMHRIPNIFGS